jgi:diguanylate cyclase (GGDEF)-like protein
MTRVTVLDMGAAVGHRPRRLFDLTAKDWGGVALVALVSVVLSVLATLASGARTVELLAPAVVIPLVVSIPASAVVFRQRRIMADLNRQMLDLLQYDPLTGLLSRRFFLAAAEAEARRGGALLLIDADRFKGINDRYGHPAGDAVLAALAERFRAAAGDDVLIGRLGGEEFAAFAPGRDASGGVALGEAIRRQVRAAAVPTERGEIVCSVSLGLAVMTPGGPLAAAITAADEALYRAKSLGRDRLCAAGDVEAVQAAG